MTITPERLAEIEARAAKATRMFAIYNTFANQVICFWKDRAKAELLCSFAESVVELIDPELGEAVPDLISEVKRLRDAQEWRTMDSAPKDGSRFLAFGSYHYPYDARPTQYTNIVEFSGDEEFPWLDEDGKNRPSVYSLWQPLPTPPVQS